MWCQGTTGHQGREGGKGDGYRDRDGDGNEDGCGNEHKIRDWGENGSGTGTGTRIKIRVDGRENLGNFEIELKVDRKTQEGGRRQRETSNHNRKTRRPSETIASCEGSAPPDGKRGK